MKRAALLCLFPFISSLASAQTFDEYMKMRKQYRITQAVGVAALETLLGSRVLEVKGRVKGSVGGPSGTSLLLERTDGESIFVRAKEVPTWLSSANDTPVRLIVKANREAETSEIQAELLGAAVEDKVASYEEAEARKLSAKAPKTYKPPRQAKEWNLPANTAIPIYAGFIKQRNKRLDDATAWRIAQGVVGFSLRYGVDARLIMAMVMVESNFNPSAVSRAGAMGLGQLMPGTARGMGVGNAFDAHDNLYGTVRLIRGHMDKYRKQTGDEFEGLVLALAAYNAGSGAVSKHGGVPPYRETQAYVRKVITQYQQLCGGR